MNKWLKEFIIAILILLLNVGLFYLADAFVFKQSGGVLLRNIIFVTVYFCGLLLIYTYSYVFQKLEYNNSEHPIRFAIIYLICFVLSVIFPFIDNKGWFFVCLAVTIAIFSNGIIACYSISGLILFTLLFGLNSNVILFFVYFIASVIAIVLFQDIEHNFNFGATLLISMVVLFILETAGMIMLDNSNLNAEQFVMPIVNIAVNALILFFVLKYFNFSIANKYRDKYLEINDQEYSLLVELKEKSLSEYMLTIHTAYLAERIALSSDADVNITKNCAYYHRYKNVFNLNTEEAVKMLEEKEFPPASIDILREYWENDKLFSKEACIVYISDLFVSLLLSIFSKDKNAKIDYKDLVESLLKKQFNASVLNDCSLTRHDINVIKDIFLKEELYYDFLR